MRDLILLFYILLFSSGFVVWLNSLIPPGKDIYRAIAAVIGISAFIAYIWYRYYASSKIENEKLLAQSKLEAEFEGLITDFLNIIEKHKLTLISKRLQGTSSNEYGQLIENKWIKDRDWFIENVLLEHQDLSRFNEEVRSHILVTLILALDTATADFEQLRPSFHSEMTGIEYEEYVKDLLTQNGWKAIRTKASGDQGVDVIAWKNDEKIVVQCKKWKGNVGNTAVQEIFTAKQHESANYAAVVTNSSFTSSAKQLASTTGVILLHDSEIEKLEKLIWASE